MNTYKRDSSKVFDGVMWDSPYISMKPQLSRMKSGVALRLRDALANAKSSRN